MECSVTRVGDSYVDQLRLTGHDCREDDLDRFAALHLRTLRYPVLWERTAPDGPAAADWSWPDRRLARLRALGIRPIVGLVHHGSGPRRTSLTDPSFVTGLAEYAGAVAERYPWVEAYTPVNEPLTTARFSGMYGHWYPHGRDGRTFAQALLTECRATVAAMAAIRRVNPSARLVQTEDMGRTSSTPSLAYQAEFDNERRWLSLDLLCGRVDRHHPLWTYLRRVGMPEVDILWFADHPCPPDVIGFNHYVTSERFLDEHLDRYPACFHGGNHRQAYADVEAVRVCSGPLAGYAGLLREAWERFRLPLAITEAHLGGTREEQLRWLLEAWDGAEAVRTEGVDVRAVTVWSLLGAYDWDSMLTRPRGRYEPGVFDLRGGLPRPTALAGLVSCLASGQRAAYDHPAALGPGWWRRPDRLLYRPVRLMSSASAQPSVRRPVVRPLLIVGDPGGWRAALAQRCAARGIARRGPSSRAIRRAPTDCVSALRRHRPWAVVLGSESGLDVASLADECRAQGSHLLILSLGRSIAGACPPGALHVRAAGVFGEGADDDVLTSTLRLVALRARVALPPRAPVVPAYLPDLLDASLDLLIDGETGAWEVGGPVVTWRRLAVRAARLAGLDESLLDAVAADEPEEPASGSVRQAVALPDLDEALLRYLAANRLMPASVAVPTPPRDAEVA